MKILALKICANTHKGYRNGVPLLIDILDELQAKASFFFAMGPEDGGSVVSKLFGEEKEIVSDAPGILRDAHRREFDCGIYAWNPQEWRTKLEKLKDTTLEAETRRAVEHFTRRTGTKPTGFAAPGFRATYMSLRIQDDLHFAYCSDTFGFYPYRPKMSWKTFRTPQIPSTLPPLEVVLHKNSAQNAREKLQALAAALPDGLSVLPLNAAAANIPEILAPFRAFLTGCRDAGVKLLDLRTVTRGLKDIALPACEVVDVKAFGMSNEVAVQVPE